MAGNTYKDRLADYITVDQRIIAFYEKHPKGSIQSQVVELTETRVVIKAYAYRDETDTKPGIGHSSMNIPGSTSFTRGSEVENAETSAWGRAIAALGFEVKKGIASRDEIENKREEVDYGEALADEQLGRGKYAKDAATLQDGSNARQRGNVKIGPDDPRHPMHKQDDRDAELQALVREARQRIGKELGDKWLTAAVEGLGVTSKTITLAQIRTLFERTLTLTRPVETTTEDDDISW